MKRLNVLIVQRILPPYRVGFFKRLSQSNKLQVTLAYGQASPHSALESVVDPQGIQVSYLKNVYFGKEETLVIQPGTLPLARSRRFDVVICEFNPRILTNLVLLWQAKRRSIPVIWWGHGIRPRGRFKKLYTFLSNAASANIFYSQAGADDLMLQGLSHEKAYVAWNSIETEEIDALAQNFEISQRNSILYIGRLIPEKKPQLLIEAFVQAVVEQHLDAKLIIIGDGPERAKLESLVKQAGLIDRVEFTGSAYQQSDLAPYFNASRFSVSPGYLGLSAIHSMAYGLPMLIADKEPHSPEIAAIEAGVNARFFTADDKNQLAQDLVQMYREETALCKMSQAARRTVRDQFSLDAMVQGFEKAIEYAYLQGKNGAE